MILEMNSPNLALQLEYLRDLAQEKPAVVGMLPEGRSIYNQQTTTLCDTMIYPDGSPICTMVGVTEMVVVAPKGGVDVNQFCQKVFPGLTTSRECAVALKDKLGEGETVKFTVENNLVSGTWEGTTITGDGSMSPKAPLLNFLQVLRQLKEAKVQKQQSTNSPLLVVVGVTVGGVIVLGLSFLALGKMSEKGAKRVSEDSNNRNMDEVERRLALEEKEGYMDDKGAAAAKVVWKEGYELWKTTSRADKSQLLFDQGSKQKAIVSLGRKSFLGQTDEKRNNSVRQEGFAIKNRYEPKKRNK